MLQKIKEDYIINHTAIANALGINSSEFIIKQETFNKELGQYEIIIELIEQPISCPHCNSLTILFKEYKTRIVRHGQIFNYPTIFRIIYRRYKCSLCSKTFNQPTSIAPKGGKISRGLIIDVLNDLIDWTSTFTSVARKRHISDTEVIKIFDTYVNPKRRVLPEIISIDEVYNKKQFSDPYSCILFDFDAHKIIDVIQDRSKYTLGKYFSKITKGEKKNVKYIVIDMWRPYLEIAEIHFPNSIVAVDSFHVLQNIARAIDSIRKRVMKRYYPGTEEYYLLKNYNYLLFKTVNPSNEKEKNPKLKKWMNEWQIQNYIYQLDDELKEASLFFLNYRHGNEATTYETADRFLDIFCNDISVSRINEMIPVIDMLQTWREYIKNSFIRANSNRLSNGPIEGFNSLFKKTLYLANGNENFQRFRNKLIFRYNKEYHLSPVKNKIHIQRRKPRGKYTKKPPKS